MYTFSMTCRREALNGTCKTYGLNSNFSRIIKIFN